MLSRKEQQKAMLSRKEQHSPLNTDNSYTHTHTCSDYHFPYSSQHNTVPKPALLSKKAATSYSPLPAKSSGLQTLHLLIAKPTDQGSFRKQIYLSMAISMGFEKGTSPTRHPLWWYTRISWAVEKTKYQKEKRTISSIQVGFGYKRRVSFMKNISACTSVSVHARHGWQCSCVRKVLQV